MRRSVAFVLLATILMVLSFVSAAYADPNNNNSAKLRAAVTLEGVRAHQLALQQIANANGGNRFAGLPGHDESVDYVVDTLEAAGYDPVVQPFDYLAFAEVGPSVLQQTAPGSITYVEGVDFAAIDQTDPGDVTANVTNVISSSASATPPRAAARLPTSRASRRGTSPCSSEARAPSS